MTQERKVLDSVNSRRLMNVVSTGIKDALEGKVFDGPTVKDIKDASYKVVCDTMQHLKDKKAITDLTIGEMKLIEITWEDLYPDAEKRVLAVEACEQFGSVAQELPPEPYAQFYRKEMFYTWTYPDQTVDYRGSESGNYYREGDLLQKPDDAVENECVQYEMSVPGTYVRGNVYFKPVPVLKSIQLSIKISPNGVDFSELIDEKDTNQSGEGNS